MLRSRYAQLLVRGRVAKGKPPIEGLIGFANRLRVVWNAAQENDPYADWWLIKIHDAIDTVDAQLQRERTAVQERQKGNQSFLALPSEVREPFRIKLNFSNAYAYKAAQTLAKFDEFVRETLTARQIGLISRTQAQSKIHAMASKIRGVFNIPLRFRHLAINRSLPESFAKDGDIAKRYMGELPPDVLSGERRAALAPPIMTNGTSNVPPVAEQTEQIGGFDL